MRQPRKEIFHHKLPSKWRAAAIFLISLSTGSCAEQQSGHDPVTTIRYGSYFELVLPLNRMQGAVLFTTGDTAIKFSDGTTISPMIITHESDSLPDYLDLKKYASYLLDEETRLEITDPEIRESFANSYAAMKAGDHKSEEISLRDNSTMMRGLCAELRCQLFVSQQAQGEQILMISSRGIAPENILKLIKEI